MRFDTPVFFQHVTPGTYDPTTGDYAPDTPVEVKRFACVTGTKTEMGQLVYGDLRQDCLTILLQTPYKEPFDSIRIGEKRYRVDYSRRLQRKHIFVVSEVQSNGGN